MQTLAATKTQTPLTATTTTASRREGHHGLLVLPRNSARLPRRVCNIPRRRSCNQSCQHRYDGASQVKTISPTEALQAVREVSIPEGVTFTGSAEELSKSPSATSAATTTTEALEVESNERKEMATRQDELRRLMKESKEKTQAKHVKHPHTAEKSVGGADGSAAAAHASNGVSQGPKPSTSAETAAMKTSIPAGFFDDSLADAKARNIDIKQVAEKQLEQDWEQFQEFVAEVEEQEEKELEIQQEEAKEKEAVEQLENMEYVDRYRIVLERAAKLGSKDATKRDAPAAEEVSSSATTTVTATSTSGSSGVDVEEEATEQVVANAFQKHVKKKRRVAKVESSGDDDDDFDPCNWRSRGF
ncbi:hypothetical protein FI667_g10897, partial [Globisporangium splendens]